MFFGQKKFTVYMWKHSQDNGGFQLEFVSISAVIGWNYNIQTKEQILLRIFFR